MIYLYGLLSSSSSQLLYSYVKSQLKSLDDAATQKEFGHLVDVMCNWGRADDVLEFISENVLSSFDQPSKAMDTTGIVLDNLDDLNTVVIKNEKGYKKN